MPHERRSRSVTQPKITFSPCRNPGAASQGRRSQAGQSQVPTPGTRREVWAATCEISARQIEGVGPHLHRDARYGRSNERPGEVGLGSGSEFCPCRWTLRRHLRSSHVVCHRRRAEAVDSSPPKTFGCAGRYGRHAAGFRRVGRDVPPARTGLWPLSPAHRCGNVDDGQLPVGRAGGKWHVGREEDACSTSMGRS
jgi:hypothetical protein